MKLSVSVDQRRATYTAAYFTLELVGTAAALALIGALSQRWSVRAGLLASALFALAGALALVIGGRTQRRPTATPIPVASLGSSS